MPGSPNRNAGAPPCAASVTPAACLALALALASCTGANERPDPPRTAMTASSALPAAVPAPSAAAASAAPSAAVSEPPGVAEARAVSLLFPGGAPAACSSASGKARVRCWVGARYEAHENERALALALFDELGDVAGTEREHQMEGGFRGVIHIVPELPVGPHERHLRWVLGAQRDIAAFLKAIEDEATEPVRYRHAGLAWRFLRSVGRTTPSAYAASWEVGYNVKGSLHGSADAVRETIFHEVFHLNDQAHESWSRRALGPMVDGLMQKCGTKVACLKPYAPAKTMVRGGTYYAFQPDNGDASHEYAAELATRYFLEHRAVLAGQRYPEGAFKCGPDENARAWQALADEFFGGVDLVPACK